MFHVRLHSALLMMMLSHADNLLKSQNVVTVTVTELHSSPMFSEESCSVGLSEKMGFQLRSELLATVVR